MDDAVYRYLTIANFYVIVLMALIYLSALARLINTRRRHRESGAWRPDPKGSRDLMRALVAIGGLLVFWAGEYLYDGHTAWVRELLSTAFVGLFATVCWFLAPGLGLSTRATRWIRGLAVACVLWTAVCLVWAASMRGGRDPARMAIDYQYLRLLYRIGTGGVFGLLAAIYWKSRSVPPPGRVDVNWFAVAAIAAYAVAQLVALPRVLAPKCQIPFAFLDFLRDDTVRSAIILLILGLKAPLLWLFIQFVQFAAAHAEAEASPLAEVFVVSQSGSGARVDQPPRSTAELARMSIAGANRQARSELSHLEGARTPAHLVDAVYAQMQDSLGGTQLILVERSRAGGPSRPELMRWDCRWGSGGLVGKPVWVITLRPAVPDFGSVTPGQDGKWVDAALEAPLKDHVRVSRGVVAASLAEADALVGDLRRGIEAESEGLTAQLHRLLRTGIHAQRLNQSVFEALAGRVPTFGDAAKSSTVADLAGAVVEMLSRLSPGSLATHLSCPVSKATPLVDGHWRYFDVLEPSGTPTRKAHPWANLLQALLAELLMDALRHGVDQPAAARPTLQVSYGPDGWQIDVRNDTTQPGWRSLEERLQTAAIIAVLGGWRLSEDREASGQGRFHVTLVGT